MKRTIDQWRNCDPRAMANNQSNAAVQFALEDAKADVLELHKEKLITPLQVGDEQEKLKLYDCETGEEVTIDGLGGNESKPMYPAGFENCEGGEVEDGFVDGVYWYARTVASNKGVVASDIS